MSKKNKFCIVIMIIFIILGLQISNVIATTNSSFFYTNKQEITAKETLEMTFDISKVKYDNFIFKLSSNLDANSIIINEDVNAQNYNNEININIDKAKINLNKITFYYEVPETSQIGAQIELLAQILVIEENDIQNEVDNNENTVLPEAEYKAVQEQKIDVKIIENSEKPNQEKPNEIAVSGQNNDSILPKEDKSVNFSTNVSKDMPNIKNQNTTYSSSSISFSNISSQVETAVYNGSNNNYLASLEIEGENLNTAFNKENTTYFVHTTGKTSLNINITAEDDNAKTYVTGNENLKTGDNKILISVTAENGDVRYYRVFVTNN